MHAHTRVAIGKKEEVLLLFGLEMSGGKLGDSALTSITFFEEGLLA
jgi:hypothetical protein